jgi:hypothetical protein
MDGVICISGSYPILQNKDYIRFCFFECPQHDFIIGFTRDGKCNVCVWGSKHDSGHGHIVVFRQKAYVIVHDGDTAQCKGTNDILFYEQQATTSPKPNATTYASPSPDCSLCLRSRSALILRMYSSKVDTRLESSLSDAAANRACDLDTIASTSFMRSG